ncbi:bifunctional glycosyltransferase/CDP-glycerol:glycerophosphate glycerophosphotransferase [Promicromonospora sukumoe]|uniref:bifunctional glycosyltransferase/CDP-glycerol:glycerophosphate glycerophosphotransferase n=1 Tax=Promicromonospora sukumoe TaxID=88382 RepID=UPI000378AC06|nr:CDP-glycerol glycerophosphotransferase family protein [Promicromonospora sukumoe]
MIAAPFRRFLGGVVRRARRPRLSVVMPCRDGGEYLEPAIRSVLNQDLRDLEVIVVDDGSTDGSREVVDRLRARDRRLRAARTRGAQGPGVARNLGVDLARGRYLAFVDADDVVLPGAYGDMVRRLRRPRVDMVMGGYQRHGVTGSHRPKVVARVHRADVLGTTAARSPEALDEPVVWNRVYRTSFWRRAVGPFPEAGNYEDREPALRATLRARRFDLLERDVYSWRLPEGRGSRSQHKAELTDLEDRVAVIERKVPLLTGAPAQVRDRVWARWLGTDLGMFAAHVPQCDDAYWAALQQSAARLAAGATPEVWSRIQVTDRLLSYVISQGSREDAEELLGTRAEDTTAVPLVVDGATLRAVPEVLGRLTTHVPEHLLVVDPALLELVTGVRRVRWVAPGLLSVTGWAYVPGLEAGTEGAVASISCRTSAGDEVACEVHPATDPEIDVESGDPWRSYARAGFEARVKVDGPRGTDLALVVTVDQGGLSWTTDLAVGLPVTDEASGPAGPDAVGVRTSGFGPARIRMNGARVDGAQVTLVGRVDPAVPSLRVGIATSRESFETTVEPAPDGSFEAPIVAPGRAAFPSDGYFARWSTKVDGPLVGWARPGRALTEGSIEVEGELQRLSMRRHGENAVSLTIGPPLTPEERSRAGQRRLRDVSRATGLERAVLFETFNGKSCEGSPRAVFAALRAAGVDVPMYWSVRDLSVPVPEGGTALIIGSADWHRALATAQVLVNNNNFPHWFTKRPGQFYLQTWHGTPIKRLLFDLPSSASPLTYRRMMRRQVPMWDLMLAQTPEAEQNLRTGLGYEGETWVVEQPANGVLYEGDGVRERVREQLGLAPDERVVLYAPTWREAHRTRSRAGTWAETLDPAGFAAAVGARVLVRSHHVSGRAVATGDGVLDVSSYPSVEELMLAADLLVSDYSSVLHDWAVTQRPAIVYAPDLELYRDVERGFYGEWPSSSPWPLTETADDLAAAVRAAFDGGTAGVARALDGTRVGDERRRLVGKISRHLDRWVTGEADHVGTKEIR